MTDERITDPETLDQIKQLDSAQPAEKITDPETLKQIKGLEGEEPSVSERFLRGATAAPRAAMEFAAPLLPKGNAQADAGKDGKLKQRPIEGFDPVEFGGSLLNPLPIAAGIGVAKALPTAGKAVQGAMAGGITGFFEPTGKPITDPEFADIKSKQVTAGLALGFGFTMGGRALSAGMEKVADFMVRKENIMSDAVQKVFKRIADNEKHTGLTAMDSIDLISTANAQGKPMRIADLGNMEEPNEGIRQLSGSVGRKTLEGRQIAKSELKARDDTARDRLNADVGQYIHSGPTAYEATEMMLSARSAAAKPLYTEADRLQGIWSPRLQRFIEDPDFMNAMKAGYASERRRALAEDRAFNATMTGIDLDVEGNIKYLRTPNLHVLDMGKRGLDALIAAERNEITGRLSMKGVDLDNMRRAYLTEIDALDTKGIYRKARASWQGPSASMDAVRLGRSIFAQGSEQGEAAFNKLTAGDQEFYRLGVADIVKERILKTGFSADETKAVIKNPWMRQQLRPAFRTEEDFNKFVDAVTKESTMFKTKEDIFGGSATAERLAGDEMGSMDMVKSRALEAAHQAVRGNPLRFIGNLYRMHRDLGLKPDPKMNEALAKILFTEEGPHLLNNPPQRVLGRTPRLRRADDITPFLGAEATSQLTEEKPTE